MGRGLLFGGCERGVEIADSFYAGLRPGITATGKVFEDGETAIGISVSFLALLSSSIDHPSLP